MSFFDNALRDVQSFFSGKQSRGADSAVDKEKNSLAEEPQDSLKVADGTPIRKGSVRKAVDDLERRASGSGASDLSDPSIVTPENTLATPRTTHDGTPKERPTFASLATVLMRRA